ncbi:sialate O-acetylesterase [Bremerella sp. P1]|uniref:sialate O-acetylesterase n=1 Tax=Bremerella sp. P1 TaxID=3026424 RepID=UPI00236811EB|nr:sialate O-acetylesterase [Bremerella sp. P1]WDI40702.1 sialate O-acetylesterase [Bremerella sp. P1]
MLVRMPALLLFAFVLFASSIATAQEAVDVYILSGQSNMAGSGNKSQLPEQWKTTLPSVQYWDGKQFADFDPMALNLNGGGRFGPEVGFSGTMASLHPGKKIYVVKFALSGQPLHAGFNGAKWMGEEPGPNRNTFYPGTSPEDPNMGNHYRRLRDQFTKAFTALKEAGLKPELKGIAWMQGEADAKQEISATTYDQSIALLKSRMEEDCQSGPVPFAMGQVLPHVPWMERFTHRAEIRQAQDDADMRNGSERAILGVWNVPTDGMPLLADTVHYDTTGQLMLGTSFALGVLEAANQMKMVAAKDDPE